MLGFISSTRNIQAHTSPPLSDGSAREREAEILARCGDVIVRGYTASTAIEANVFGFAASLLQHRRSDVAEKLRLASDAFFREHRDESVTPSQMVERGWIVSMPRFRDQLERYLVERAL